MSPLLNGVIAAVVISGAAFLGHAPSFDPVPSSAAAAQVPASDLLAVTAAHEAGHVAALREFGIPVLRVQVADDGSGKTTYPDHFYSDPVRDAYDCAVVDAAGQESAAAWLVEHRGYTLDSALAAAEPPAHSDLVKLADDAARAGISEAEARQRARDIIRNHRADIDRTAQQLVASSPFDEE
jgi:hypothetical protein